MKSSAKELKTAWNSFPWILLEFLLLTLALPLLLFATGTRLGIYCALWGIGIYAFLGLRRQPDYDWARLWHGEGWKPQQKLQALIRFILLAVLLTALTLVLKPERFFGFPRERFPLWLAVMVLYPWVSVLPQELFFRSYYFARFGSLIRNQNLAIIVNGILFGFSHIVLNNWIAPTFCAIGGALFARSYWQHRSLKWIVIEHALYGCWIFTVGIGWYFFTGNWRP